MTNLASVIVKLKTSSALSEVSGEPGQLSRLPVSGWMEESFAMTIHDRGQVRLPAGMVDFENIEAVGAADDAARFRIEFETFEVAGSTA